MRTLKNLSEQNLTLLITLRFSHSDHLPFFNLPFSQKHVIKISLTTPIRQSSPPMLHELSKTKEQQHEQYACRENPTLQESEHTHQTKNSHANNVATNDKKPESKRIEPEPITKTQFMTRSVPHLILRTAPVFNLRIHPFLSFIKNRSFLINHHKLQYPNRYLIYKHFYNTKEQKS
jgi:hypothetical protein